MRIFYLITKIIVFPGAYLRGFWEQITAKILGLYVEPGGYLRLDESIGHVEHSLPKTQFAAYLMATGPGFMNFNMGLMFFAFGHISIRYLGITPYDSLGMFILYIVSMYLGVSLLCCTFPLTEDVLNFWDIAYLGHNETEGKLRKIRDMIGKILGFPIILITRVGAFLERNGITFILWVLFLVWDLILFDKVLF